MFVDASAAQLLDNAQLTAQVDGNEIAFGLSQAGSENGTPPA